MTSQQPKSLREEIEEVLARIFYDGVNSAGTDYAEYLSGEEDTDDLIALIKTVGTKVIGEDEQVYTKFTPEKDFTTNLLNSQKMARNNLRSDQRKALEDIVEGRVEI